MPFHNGIRSNNKIGWWLIWYLFSAPFICAGPSCSIRNFSNVTFPLLSNLQKVTCIILRNLFGLYLFSHQSCATGTLFLRKQIYPRKSSLNLRQLTILMLLKRRDLSQIQNFSSNVFVFSMRKIWNQFLNNNFSEDIFHFSGFVSDWIIGRNTLWNLQNAYKLVLIGLLLLKNRKCICLVCAES